MPDTPDPTSSEKKRTIADAAEFLRDSEAKQIPSSVPGRPSSDPGASGYDIAEHEPSAKGASAPSASPKLETSPRPVAGRRTRAAPVPEATVEQVWSRSAEWGPNLAVLAIVGLVFLVLLYLALASEDYQWAFLWLLAGGATLLVLSYPIVITLERPVRVTPEQAVTDFFAALSHHVPHYRRMWLLLSSAGRKSMSYASYTGFKNYWKSRLAQFRGDRASGFTPLIFKVDDFKSEKSAGMTAIDVKYTINVYLRGKQHEGPINSIPVNMGLTKGPDQMWYLNKGTLPGGGT